MVPLPDSFKAFMFQGNVDRVRDAYRASAATMETASREASEAAARYEASGEDDSEYEDGALVFSTRNSLDYASMNAGLAVTVVREAFITSALHLWETSARGWTGLHKPGHNFDFLSAASAEKYPVNASLKHLNLLNNYIKHRNPTKAETLAFDRPDYFSTLLGSRGDKAGPLRLRITHDHVEEAFEIVSKSGPRFTDTPATHPTAS